LASISWQLAQNDFRPLSFTAACAFGKTSDRVQRSEQRRELKANYREFESQRLAASIPNDFRRIGHWSLVLFGSRRGTIASRPFFMSRKQILYGIGT